MKANNFKGVRYLEPQFGERSNLNRCFGREGSEGRPLTSAEKRAKVIVEEVERFVEDCGIPEVIDIHQSFAVPRLNEVRGNGVGDRSEYTYAMAYPYDSEETSLKWFYDGYSDIVAAVVLHNMEESHHTFASYMARRFGAHAATFEQGTVGYVDVDTFVPQLTANLLRKVTGEVRLTRPEGFDVWRCVRGIRKRSDDFRFIDRNGFDTSPPQDFLPIHEGTVAVDDSILHILHAGERLLFANADVALGDRAAAVVVRYDTSIIPPPT